jgi:hypothetical protein
MPLAISVVKCLMFASVFFVWVVRYQNIVQEFRAYQYPDWLRDIVGITKLTAVVLIMSSDTDGMRLGAVAIGLLMIAALGTHVKVKNPPAKMLPSFVLLLLSCFLVWTVP